MVGRGADNYDKAEKRSASKFQQAKQIFQHPLVCLLFVLIVTIVVAFEAPLLFELWNTLEIYFRPEPAKLPQYSLFGLSEYLAALALLFVVLTVSDFRYRFRLLITAIDTLLIAFVVSFGIGFLILIIDVWFYNGWPIPAGLNNSNNLKMILALLFLGMTCYLSYIAFISPPKFSRWNARKAFDAMHHFVARGNPEQLVVIADWLGSSASRIVELSAKRTSDNASLGGDLPFAHKDYAAYTLSLLGNKKLCRQMVEKSPWTVAELFRAAGLHPHAQLPISQFASNAGTELVTNPQSALYIEDDGYTSGFLGFTKPITTSIFGNFELVEELAKTGGSPLDIDISISFDLTASQLAAYARAVMIFSRSYFAQPYPHHSYAFTSALRVFEHSTMSLSALGELGDQYWRSDDSEKLKVTVRFIKDLVELLAEYPTPVKQRKREYELDGLAHVHRQIAKLIFEIVKSASRLRSPEDICWSVQHNTIWSDVHLEQYGFQQASGLLFEAFYV